MTRTWTRRALLTAAVAGLAACGDDDAPATDAGAADVADVGIVVDAAVATDAGPAVSDSGPPADVAGDGAVAAGADISQAQPPGPTEAEVLAKFPPRTKFDATVRWTAWGIPHITAADVGGAAFGQGYAFARDNACYLADQVVKATGNRARWFGEGKDKVHLKSDLAYKGLMVRQRALQTWTQLSADARDVMAGYAAGFNQRIAEQGPKGLPDGCVDAPWVKPISALDVLTYLHDVALLASGRNFRQAIVDAQAPAKQGAVLESGPAWLRPVTDILAASRSQLAWARELPDFRHLDIGSNGWAIGKTRSANGRGMVLANPHFPWFGELRFWESHLTVPGVADVYGVNLYGLPGIAIGFTPHIAWTMTVSASRKFVLYQLELDKQNPTTYLVDGLPRKMTYRDETVDVKQPDGKLAPVTQRFWRSHLGPIVAVGGVPWTPDLAIALWDGNGDNGLLIEHMLGLHKAKSAAEAEAASQAVQANPWTNTMLADKDGEVFYTESNSTPNLSAATAAWHKDAIDKGTHAWTTVAWTSGAVLLPGNAAAFEPVAEPGSRVPGLVPFAKTPHQRRSDYVLNANDSHWLTNLNAPLEGYGYLFGPEKTTRSARTRENLLLATEVTATGASGADGKFSADELAAVFSGGRSWLGDSYAPGLAAHCAGAGKLKIAIDKAGNSCLAGKACDGKTEPEVDLAKACQLILAWDRRFTVGSVGAVLAREWFAHVPGALFLLPYDPKNPGLTPALLKAPPAPGLENPILLGLGAAMVRLQEAGLDLASPLGKVQFTLKGDKRLEVPGGTHGEGAFNVIGWGPRNDTRLPDMLAGKFVNPATALTKDGYPVNYGSSFVMALHFTDTGPVAKAVLTYSNAANPKSKHFSDQTEALVQTGKWRDALFTEAAIAADPELKTEKVSVP
ncbi:MAG: acylase [Myxococcales bacterium]|nr:acylase [Myxococcales bacterium]